MRNHILGSVTLEEVSTYLLVLLCCVHVNPTHGFSLNNCTIGFPFQYSGNLKVTCNRMGYREVPTPLPNDTVNLDISFNSISKILHCDFIRLTHLITLNMSHNRISEIEGSTFSSLSNLTELNLSNNKLNNVSAGLLSGLISLSHLMLDSNYIETIENQSFVTLSNLRCVNLTSNRLQHISRLHGVLQVPTLEHLYLGKNGFAVLNSSDFPSALPMLKLLDLSLNPLTVFKITENIFPALEYLNLSRCFYKGSVDWTVSDKMFLNSVKTLNLSKSNISEKQLAHIIQSFSSVMWMRLNDLKGFKVRRILPVKCSPPLRGLAFEDNDLSVLTDETFRPCTILNELHLRNNRISRMYKSSFKDLNNLTVLRIQKNKLTELNGTLQDLHKLQLLDLHLNHIENLDCSDFANLTELRTLYLHSNRITTIKACIFKHLEHLYELDLSSNSLLTVGYAFTNGPQNLKHLNLKSNKLSVIQNNSFKGLRSLLVLELEDNQILDIKSYGFAGMTNLTELNLSSNKITERKLRNHTIFSSTPSLRNLHMSCNYLSYESHEELQHPPFASLTELKVLAINSQRRGLRYMPSNFLKGLKHLQAFYAGNLNMEHLHVDTFSHTPNLVILDLSSNNFADRHALTAMVFHPIPGLEKLTLVRAHLQTLDFFLEANLTNLRNLRANINDLQLINQTVIQSLPHLKILDLHSNSFTCDCSNAWFVDWAIMNNDTQVPYLNMYKCRYPPSLSGSSLATFDKESCNVHYDFVCFVYSFTAIIVTMIISFIYHFLKWQVVYAYYLFIAFLNDRKRRGNKNHEFQYDAFISYNVREEPWVMEELVPNLEGQHGMKLCIHHRDFQPGKAIIDNIVDGIYNSRKTICLITQNYLKSVWCSNEIQVASFRLFDEQKDVLILVFLEDIPIHQLSPYYRMRKLVRKRSYLQWPKPGTDTKVFWQKLKMAIETKETMEDDTPILSGQEKEHL